MAESYQEDQARIAGLIYAGGRGMRMGGVDKALIMHDGEPLIAHMARALGAYADNILISRQKDQADLVEYGEVVFDESADQGPLAGLLAGIEAARDYDYLLTAAVDAHGLPEGYAGAMRSAARPHAMARAGENLHPTFAFIDLSATEAIVSAYQNGERALRSWVDVENCGFAHFHADAFLNINIR